jgi:hypothetical protein
MYFVAFLPYFYLKIAFFEANAEKIIRGEVCKELDENPTFIPVLLCHAFLPVL